MDGDVVRGRDGVGVRVIIVGRAVRVILGRAISVSTVYKLIGYIQSARLMCWRVEEEDVILFPSKAPTPIDLRY